MSNKLLSAIEDDVFLSEGSVPFVIEGLEHSYDTKDSLPDESMHNSHELLYLREGKIDLIIGNETITLTKGSVIVIRPLVRHKLVIKSSKADMLSDLSMTFQILKPPRNRERQTRRFRQRATAQARAYRSRVLLRRSLWRVFLSLPTSVLLKIMTSRDSLSSLSRATRKRRSTSFQSASFSKKQRTVTQRISWYILLW